MRIGIIGAGAIGGTLARRLAKRGHQVSIANSRGPESLAALAAEIGATPVSVVDAAHTGEIVIISIPTKAVADLPRDLFANVPSSVVVIDTGNYHPELRDGRIDAIDRGMLDSQWVAHRLGRPVIKAFNNILAKSLLEKGVPRGTTGRIALSVAGDSFDAKATVLRPILASTPWTVVIWTTPGGSSPERRLTAWILKPALSGARSPRLIGAGSPNTAPNGRLISEGILPAAATSPTSAEPLCGCRGADARRSVLLAGGIGLLVASRTRRLPFMPGQVTQRPRRSRRSARTRAADGRRPGHESGDSPLLRRSALVGA